MDIRVISILNRSNIDDFSRELNLCYSDLNFENSDFIINIIDNTITDFKDQNFNIILIDNENCTIETLKLLIGFYREEI